MHSKPCIWRLRSNGKRSRLSATRQTRNEQSSSSQMSSRRFPPPWSVEETDACFIVRDTNRQALAYVYFRGNPAGRAAAKFLIRTWH
jgi:hypothetical protein